MTYAQAAAIAKSEAERTRMPMFVMRLPAWPPDCFAVFAHGNLPDEATIERFDPAPDPPPQGRLF